MPRRSPPLLLLALLLASLAAACGEAAPAEDAGPPDSTADAAGTPPIEDNACVEGEREVRPVGQAAPIALPTAWRQGGVSFGQPDPILARLAAGAITELPAVGVDSSGVEWFDSFAGANGTFQPGIDSKQYFVAELVVPEGRYVFARSAALGYVGTPRSLAPGDPYAAGWSRVPVVVGEGLNVLTVQVSSRVSRQPALELFETTDEVLLNLADRTAPDLRVGDASPQWLGVATLNLTDVPLADFTARVVESEHWEATEVAHRSLPGGATTQVAFELRPKATWAEAELEIPVTLQVESPCLQFAYEVTTTLTTRAADEAFRRTFRSPMDRSAQFYGVRAPTTEEAGASYGLALSLHGAGVDGRGQAAAYSAKDWAYIIAPTNRRPFGFDWEAWGRLDGLEVLADAQASYAIDPLRVFVTGHSMGGHGTWQFGTLFPERFALVGPSAGWRSFYTYGGSPRPEGALYRAVASSDTEVYADNLLDRSVFILHGDADDNVPVTEARAMRALLTEREIETTGELGYHEQPGAGHWWDADRDEPGADCVDWEPMFARMEGLRRDPTELDFAFHSPSARVSNHRSYVRVTSVLDANEDFFLTSVAGEVQSLSTTNVRGMILDGAALLARGVTSIDVDGETLTLEDGDMAVGPQTGKRPEQEGPLYQALEAPYCYVYDQGSPAWSRLAAVLTTSWSIIGNGHACAVPVSEVDDELRADFNLIWLGVAPADTGVEDLPFTWSASRLGVPGEERSNAVLAFTYPAGDHLDAFITTTAGLEAEAFGLVAFTSRSALPDYLLFSAEGETLSGFFGPEWEL
jgi:dienelactone hydrolase